MLKTKFIPYIMLVYEKPYDALGQLRRENNASTNTTSAWNYDTLGNIESVITYDYTTGDLGNLETGIDYQYTDDGKSGWSRLLTTLVYKTYTYDAEGNRTTTVNDTKTITYDNIGNPVNYLGANLTWRGRQLKKYVDGSTTVSYLYDANGLRGSKTVGNSKTEYLYAGDLLRYQVTKNKTTNEIEKEFYFFYDSYNNLTAIRYISGSTDNYYYVTTNLQGDVLGIYTGGGVLLASYEYDAWGNCTVTSHNANFTIGNDNPIRYRGYYYDSETGLYYLQSRYYDPEIGRFINADGYVTTGQGVLSYNMFAYCSNSPVMYSDPSGYSVLLALGIVYIVTAASIVVAGTFSALSTNSNSYSPTKSNSNTEDITDKLNNAMQENAEILEDYSNEHGFIDATINFVDKVKPGGEWDFKSKDSWNLNANTTYSYNGINLRFDDIGNIHYGYVGRVLFDKKILLIAGGLVQIYTGYSSWYYCDFYFDDPQDQWAIGYGSFLWDSGVVS